MPAVGTFGDQFIDFVEQLSQFSDGWGELRYSLDSSHGEREIDDIRYVRSQIENIVIFCIQLFQYLYRKRIR